VADEFAEAVVDSINELSGRHPGHRAAHAKGILCTGTFVATPAAAALTRAAHMQGDPLRATVRFSNGGGDPEVPDYANEGRGVAVKLYLPDGSRTDFICLSLPSFFVRTPEDFLEFTQLRKPDPETGQPNMERLGEWLGRHPEAGPAIQAALAASPPASYATVAYNSIHAYRWLDAEGGSRYVRLRLEPEAGVAELSQDEARAEGRDYLQRELPGRFPFAFRLVVQIADEGDPVDDPTIAWPAGREHVEVGRLEVTGLEEQRERDGDVLVFDPLRVTDGIEPSDDPILHFRSRAYSVSVERRSGAVRASAP
jgi:catalase